MVEITKNRHDLLDLIQVAFIITDVHLKVVHSNLCTERLFGYARGEIEGLIYIRQKYFLKDQPSMGAAKPA